MYLHRKHGLNPTLTNCYFCGEPDRIVLVGSKTQAFKDVGLAERDGRMSMNIGVLDMEPCNKCKGYMKDGVILISIRAPIGDEMKGPIPNPYRTGGWIVVKREAIARWRDDSPEGDNIWEWVLKHGFGFIEDGAWDKMRLPRGAVDA